MLPLLATQRITRASFVFKKNRLANATTTVHQYIVPFLLNLNLECVTVTERYILKHILLF